MRSDVDISKQIELETQRIHKKYPNSGIIAYFQKNTSTYDTIENLRKKYYEAFDEFYKNNSAEPMIELIAEYVIERMEMLEGD